MVKVISFVKILNSLHALTTTTMTHCLVDATLLRESRNTLKWKVLNMYRQSPIKSPDIKTL